MLRPTLQGRKGFDPAGFGPGVGAPFGYSSAYVGMHNGEDHFWLGKESSLALGISTEQSKRVYPVVDGPVNHTDDTVLGLGVWQQIDSSHRAYWWHLRDREPARTYTTGQTIGRMGTTGTGAGRDEHLHFEVRRSPYRKVDRINPAPFYSSPDFAGDGTPDRKETDMPILVSLVQGNPPTHVGDYAIVGDGGVVGLQRDRDAQLIETAKRAMWDREPIYGTQADQLAALFARVAVKPAAAPPIDYPRLAAEVAKLVKVPTAAENGAAARAAIILD